MGIKTHRDKHIALLVSVFMSSLSTSGISIRLHRRVISHLAFNKLYFKDCFLAKQTIPSEAIKDKDIVFSTNIDLYLKIFFIIHIFCKTTN